MTLLERLSPHIAGKQLVIWDWNGTLLDDRDLCLSIVNGILADIGHGPISKERYLDVFRFPVRDYYRDIGVNDADFQTHGPRFAERYYQRVGEASLFARSLDTIHALRSMGARSIILSASDERALRVVTDRVGITPHVDRVCGLENHHATSKVARALAVAAEIGIAPDRVFLIGDTDHDVEVARAIGCDCALLEGGHQSAARLRRLGVPVIARD